MCFNKRYTEVCVSRDQGWGPIALRENHNDHAMLSIQKRFVEGSRIPSFNVIYVSPALL